MADLATIGSAAGHGCRRCLIQEVSNKKLAAGLLAIFFGALGVHKFVLGYNQAGIVMLLVGVAAVSCLRTCCRCDVADRID